MTRHANICSDIWLPRLADLSRVPPFLRPACKMAAGRRSKPWRDIDVQGSPSSDAERAAPDVPNGSGAKLLRRPSRLTSRRMSDGRAGAVPVAQNSGRKLADLHRDSREQSGALRKEQSRSVPLQLVSSPPRDGCAG